jgi:hypothetical protein
MTSTGVPVLVSRDMLQNMMNDVEQMMESSNTVVGFIVGNPKI